MVGVLIFMLMIEIIKVERENMGIGKIREETGRDTDEDGKRRERREKREERKRERKKEIEREKEVE